MEFCDGGDLHHAIKQRKGVPMPEHMAKQWFIQSVFALRYVHINRVLHRDLKSQNIFLLSNGQLKLGDFGISKILTATKDYAKTMVGTPYYLSPEIIEEQPYGYRSDIWSLGVVLYEMLTLRHPFDASSLHFLAVKILKGKYPPPVGYTQAIVDVVDSILSKDPLKRPDLDQIARNPIFSSSIQEVNERYALNWDLTWLNESPDEIEKQKQQERASSTSRASSTKVSRVKENEPSLTCVKENDEEEEEANHYDASEVGKTTSTTTKNPSQKRKDIERAIERGGIRLEDAPCAPATGSSARLPPSPLANQKEAPLCCDSVCIEGEAGGAEATQKTGVLKEEEKRDKKEVLKDNCLHGEDDEETKRSGENDVGKEARRESGFSNDRAEADMGRWMPPPEDDMCLIASVKAPVLTSMTIKHEPCPAVEQEEEFNEREAQREEEKEEEEYTPDGLKEEEEDINEVFPEPGGGKMKNESKEDVNGDENEDDEDEYEDEYESDFESFSSIDDAGSHKALREEEEPLMLTGSKQKCLKKYLLQHLSEEEFDRAYTLVQNASEATDLREEAKDLLQEKTENLLPLLQLLCVLEVLDHRE